MGTGSCISRPVAGILTTAAIIIILIFLVVLSPQKSRIIENPDTEDADNWENDKLNSTDSPQYYSTKNYDTLEDYNTFSDEEPEFFEVYNEKDPHTDLHLHTDKPGLWKSYRLPGTLSPQYYNITMWPRLFRNIYGIYNFTGHSGVAFTCVKETDLILIHSNKLNYTLTPEGHHAKLTGLEGAKAPAINKTWLEVETQYLVIQLSETLQVGSTYWLYMEFQGELADDLRGFYRTEYVEDGVKKIIATTRMEPTDARKAFPCFDEPAMKAVFHVTLIHPFSTVALSNGKKTPVRRKRKLKSNIFFRAHTIPFFYENVKRESFFFFQIRVWARRQALVDGHGEYARSITGHILDYFQNYYNSTYPMPKSDQIALPNFSAAAMENWGLITYRETALLYDPKTSSNEDKEHVAIIIAHELAHMWFGNLVTMKWWNDLWLNEGFATYVSYLGVDDVQPTWNIKDLMVLNVIHDAFEADALSFSHPLSLPEEQVNTPEKISALFDTITYSKGGAVLRMLSEFLSEPVFARGLSAYLKQFAYGNTVYTDLWGKLQEVVDADPEVNLPATISEIMNRWILQMGFPVVTIDTRTGNITQNHFLSDADSKPSRSSPYNYEWFVPISWMKNGTLMDRYWLLEKNATHDPMKTDSEWLLANVNVSGFYRVNYDPQNWQRLLSQLSTDHSVRSSVYWFSRGVGNSSLISLYLSEEREYQPWKSATKNLNNLFDKFRRTIKMHQFIQYIKLNQFSFHRYNLDNAISLACSAGLEDCVNLTTEWYRLWMENPDKNSINPSMRRTVYCNGIAAGGVDEWLFAWKMYFSSSSAAEKERLQYALSCTRYYEILNLALEEAACFLSDPLNNSRSVTGINPNSACLKIDVKTRET
uniref:Aminopeptidase n=1 Tax=Astyanax mexicanus TaxID=7994 RepID=A0A8B9H7W6_ASTMX